MLHTRGRGGSGRGIALRAKERGLIPSAGRPIAIDLFAGAGGLSLGFAQAGFCIAQAIEADRATGETYRANRQDTHLVSADIRTIDPVESIQQVGLGPNDVTAIIGGPPCQGFSESNRRTRSIDNPRNSFYQHMLRFVDQLRPEWLVIENVAGLRTMAKGKVLSKILADVRDLDYEVEWVLLNAADFGVPQIRRRLFIIGNRVGHGPLRLNPSHGISGLPYNSVGLSISDLPILDNGNRQDPLPYSTTSNLSAFQQAMRMAHGSSSDVTGNLVTRNASYVIDRYRHVPQGGNWTNIPIELMGNYKDRTRCHTGIYHRLSWDAPSKVIGNFRKNMLIHPEQDRGLSIREAARLQSFPDWYVFKGLIESQQQQVSDAVPPLLAQSVARAILDAMGVNADPRASFSEYSPTTKAH